MNDAVRALLLIYLILRAFGRRKERCDHEIGVTHIKFHCKKCAPQLSHRTHNKPFLDDKKLQFYQLMTGVLKNGKN